MHLAALALTFVAVFAVELPDKTFLATLVLATRFRPLLVWIGAAAAFLVQTTVAVLLGRAAGLLPENAVHLAAAAMFVVGAVVLLREGAGHHRNAREEATGDGADGAADPPEPKTGIRAVGASFLVLFAAEWGDLSQLLTISLVARYRAPAEVFAGALAALLLVALLAVVVGRTLLQLVALHWLHYAGAALCLGMAVLTAVELAT